MIRPVIQSAAGALICLRSGPIGTPSRRWRPELSGGRSLYLRSDKDLLKLAPGLPMLDFDNAQFLQPGKT